MPMLRTLTPPVCAALSFSLHSRPTHPHGRRRWRGGGRGAIAVVAGPPPAAPSPAGAGAGVAAARVEALCGVWIPPPGAGLSFAWGGFTHLHCGKPEVPCGDGPSNRFLDEDPPSPTRRHRGLKQEGVPGIPVHRPAAHARRVVLRPVVGTGGHRKRENIWGRAHNLKERDGPMTLQRSLSMCPRCGALAPPPSPQPWPPTPPRPQRGPEEGHRGLGLGLGLLGVCLPRRWRFCVRAPLARGPRT